MNAPQNDAPGRAVAAGAADGSRPPQEVLEKVSALDRLRARVGTGEIEDVIVALPDVQGRLVGQRIDARHFCDQIASEGLGACVYLLSVDVDMQTGPGYAVDAERLGFGDMVLRPDLSTLRTLPWEPSTVAVLADPVDAAGREVEVAPRTILRRQLERLRAAGLTARAAVELEFLLFGESYGDAQARGYRGLTPATRHGADYALAGLEGLDPVVRRIRREMRQVGLQMESARGEVHPGQYEIVFRYTDALGAADQAVLYRTGAKVIAAQEGAALTFMAKYDEGEGNSGHLHVSLRSADGTPVFAASGREGAGSAPAEGQDPHTAGMSPLMAHFVAGQLALLREFTLLFAPNVNSYKRLAPGAFAPTALAWGRDNRLCPVRVVGQDRSLRIEHRVPGADANPYLSLAAVLAAGLYGIEHRLPLEPGTTGAPAGERPRLPESLADAVAAWESSQAAVQAFGPDVVAHYATAARTELRLFGRAVTDWELARGFERL